MAGFTFGAGNARALLRAPLYLAGWVASRLVPRDDRLWVFGSGTGPGEGALALFTEAEQHTTKRLVWLASSDVELARARSLGLRAVRKDGWRGFRLTLRARVAVVTHGFGDVNRFAVPGTLVVQLWHGIPLKRLHLDSPAALRLRPLPDHRLVRAAMTSLYRRAGRQIGLLPAASALSAARLRSAFGVGANVVAVTGDPRDDVLLAGTSAQRRAEARRLLAEAVGELPASVILYAPTWRDGAPDPALPSAAEWTRIAGWLGSADRVLLVRPHPLGVGDYAAGVAASERIRMLPPNVSPDVMPLLPGVDVLVTDYSSIAFDYALTGGPIVFLAPDLGQYEASRGMYEPYRDFSGDTHVSDWNAVMELVDGAADDERLLAHTRRLRVEHFDLDGGGAARRVLAEILRRTGEAPSTLTATATATATATGEAPPTATAAQARSELERALVDDIALDDDELLLGGPGEMTAVRLVGQRLTLEAEVAQVNGRWTARMPLVAARWGGPALAPPSGAYRLELTRGGVRTRRVDAATLPAQKQNASRITSLARASVSTSGGAVTVLVEPPLSDADRAGQRELERTYRRTPVGRRPAVFFESFYGQAAACNPRAIDARLAVERADVVRYWSTVDASVAVPDGAIRVVEGSAQWWTARAEARLLVVNDWLRKRYRARPGQKVLQTWHGTMLKRLALDRADVGARTRLAVRRERARWDILLAQNDYSRDRFRSAYGFSKEIWVTGYPRDDALVDKCNDGIRARLGIDPRARVVLYAPTWRDDRAEIVDFLDLPRLAHELGSDTTVLVRGHSRTLRYGRNIVGDGLLDVTTYPDVADLLAVTDVLVTDYSSVMFDFSATGRPIVFFTPDLRHYADDLRGFYFDLLADAPGAVVATQSELVDAIESTRTDADAHSSAYARWRRRFNPFDDGRAAERVVDRILLTGLLD